jgi:hypothetical protein
MKRAMSILASGAAMAGLLTSAMVLAHVPTDDAPGGKRVAVTVPVPGKRVADPVVANEMRRLRQLSKQLQPFYRYELMHARTICELKEEQLHKMRPDLDAAYERVIVKIAARNDEVFKSADAEDIDYSAAIRQAVLAVVERHVTPEQKAACIDDFRLRLAARKEAGVAFLVATIDRELLLTDRQRHQIAESLSTHWDDRWCDALEFVLGSQTAIPRIPDRLVTGYLSATQQETWRRIPRFTNRLWGVNIDHGGDPAQEQELGGDAKASLPAGRLPGRLGPSRADKERRGKTG